MLALEDILHVHSRRVYGNYGEPRLLQWEDMEPFVQKAQYFVRNFALHVTRTGMVWPGVDRKLHFTTQFKEFLASMGLQT